LFRNKTFEEVEQADFEKEPTYIPFRLTQNFVEFIGQVGLYGLFAGAMTSCSLALSEQIEKLSPFLGLVLRDQLKEDLTQNQMQQLDALCQINTKFILFKIQSLSNHNKIIEMQRGESDRLYDEYMADNDRMPDDPPV